MSVSLAGISLLEDTVVTLYCDGTGDTGVPQASFTASSVLNVDKVTYKDSVTTVDHSGGQSRNEFHRTKKGTGEATIEAKMLTGYGTGAYANMAAGVQAKITSIGTLGSGTEGATFQGFVTDVEQGFDGPSTIKFTFKPYGTRVVRSST